MKRNILLAMSIVSGVFFSGCVQATFEKKVEVFRDPDGKITKIVETETILQPGYTFGEGVQPEHLRYGKENKNIVNIGY